jgi:Ca2+-binding EF-hand superfamily protein
MTAILREVATEVGTDVTQLEVEEVFWEVDTNNDGMIGIDEFRNFLY